MHEFVVAIPTYFQYSIDIQEACDRLSSFLVADTNVYSHENYEYYIGGGEGVTCHPSLPPNQPLL